MIARLLSLVILLGVICGGIAAWGYAQFVRPGPLAVGATVVIEHGTSVEGIAVRLAQAGVIEQPYLFRIGVRAMGLHAALKAGEYAVHARISQRDVALLLQSGRTIIRRLTIAEGLTTAQVLNRIAATGGLVGPVGPSPGEGRLLPETYHFSCGDSRRAMTVRMAESMEDLLAKSWSGRNHDLAINTPEQALILASIVERETAVPQERARIAAVFHNRLRKGMRLQSDPTVAYGLDPVEGLQRPLSRADLKQPTPYNTYLVNDLPPGPICNPGRAAIQAVLHPAKTDELYFVADGTGGHAFARTLKEHNRNVRRWRRFQKQRREGEETP